MLGRLDRLGEAIEARMESIAGKWEMPNLEMPFIMTERSSYSLVV